MLILGSKTFLPPPRLFIWLKAYAQTRLHIEIAFKKIKISSVWVFELLQEAHLNFPKGIKQKSFQSEMRAIVP